ncbi:hypothetical protein SAMD00019534_072090 [Acytostelium subglobosum LB1]|uniref:hypothetical protein n=1 Tax=Acytostelium subglobosum LB1 TaxID=1410327 RepID=UPI000644ADEA|nr:hypothetical protein SAMD00019534_072090 [Acytostelium subglobosum LB1]GAM24034.1 hypothetical protein SAMD00019534_072090 [Acytostelium subglobosum LB1]|eukprot:XP_012753070.1 hypothetical protein SAMD00019534_072090 [Acytostelium subglobosum LB1]
MVIEYNKELKPLEKALEECKKSALFCCQGESELPMPRIDVKDVGVLSFPMSQQQLQSMIVQRATHCDGKGSHVWQIQNTDISITGRHFHTFFDRVIVAITASMGLTSEKVTAELYKMLIYEKGSDLKGIGAEKADKMFGTLVLSLPCAHRGGDLVIKHSGRNEVVSLENDSMSAIKWTAFITDCQHEVKPVTEGNRVCLVYNLMRSGVKKLNVNVNYAAPIIQSLNRIFAINPPVPPKRTSEEGISASNKITKKAKTSTTTTLTTMMDEFQDEDKDLGKRPEKLVYVLEYEYSKSDFTLDSLDGVDALLARQLMLISEEAQIKLGLAFMHINESGETKNGIKEQRRLYFSLKNVKDIETGEMIIDANTSLEYKELISEDCWNSFIPDKEENDHDTYSRYYKLSALLIWSTAVSGKFTMVSSVDIALYTLNRELVSLGGIDANPCRSLDLFRAMCTSLERIKQKTPEYVTSLLSILSTIKDDRYMPDYLK